MREFMDEEDDVVAAADLPQVCDALRTKNAFGNHVGYRPWQKGESSTAVYWCLQTMSTTGPDEMYVHPRQCCSGRRCFRREEP
jgi:hypothetical protein